MNPEDVLKDFEVNNCRVCFDIKDWKKKAQKAAFDRPVKAAAAGGLGAGTVVFTDSMVAAPVPQEYRNCPPDAVDLGRSTWTFLHTMSVYYPDRPTGQEQGEMSTFLELFSKLYPCSYCASHLREEMKKTPPVVESRSGLAAWLCRMHNEVNERLGKPMFDCGKVDERWKSGPPDGSCG